VKKKQAGGYLLIALFALILMGCPEKKGPLEKAGKKLDNAAGEVKDAVKDAADEVEDAVDK